MLKCACFDKKISKMSEVPNIKDIYKRWQSSPGAESRHTGTAIFSQESCSGSNEVRTMGQFTWFGIFIYLYWWL